MLTNRTWALLVCRKRERERETTTFFWCFMIVNFLTWIRNQLDLLSNLLQMGDNPDLCVP